MTLANLLEAGAHLATLLGIPIFVYGEFRRRNQERQEAEYGTYDALAREYTDFLKVAVQHPRLDVGDCVLSNPITDLTEIEITTRNNLYCMLLSIFERAYLMYKDKSKKTIFKEWTGWDRHIERYLNRPGFREAFMDGRLSPTDRAPQYNSDFEDYFWKKIQTWHQ